MAKLNTMTSSFKTLPRIVHVLMMLLALFALYCASVLWLLPLWLKKAIPEYTQQHLGAALQIKQLDINPLTLEIAIQGVELKHKDEMVLQWETVHTNLDPWRYVKTRAFYIHTLNITGLNLNIQRYLDGTLNLGVILDKLASQPEQKTSESETPTPTTEATPVVIESLSLIDSKVQYSEERPGKAEAKVFFSYDISGDIQGSNISTGENQLGKLTSTLRLKNAGTLSSNIDLQIKPLKVSGHIDIDKLVLGDAFHYVADNFRFKLTNGLLNARIPFTFEDSHLTIQDSQVVLQNVFIDGTHPDADTLIDAPNISATGVSLNTENAQVTINALNLSPGTVKTRLDNNYQASLLKLFAPINSKPSQGEQSAWQIVLNQLSLNKWTLALIDESQKKPIRVQLSPTTITVNNYSTKTQKLDIAVDTKIQSGGSLKAQGPIKLQPFSTDLAIEVDQFNLPVTQPYWHHLALVDLLSGHISTKGQLKVSPTPTKSLSTTFQGNVVINDVKTQDRAGKRPLVNWKQTSLNNLAFTTTPLALTIPSIDIDALYAKVIVNKDQTINLQKLIETAPASPKPKAQKAVKSPVAKPKSALDLEIGNIKLTNSRLDFTDQNIQPNFNADIQKLRGNISGIGNNKKQHAIINLRGSVNSYAPVTIAGRFNPDNFSEFADVAVNFRNIDMTAFSPYSGTFAGYKIQKGKLRVDLHYIIDNRALSAKNYIFADQLTLGERVESPSATSLPVKLAISLLKNSKGEIEIDLPLSGNIDNPSFSVSGLIARAFTNLIKQTLSAPFKMLSNLVGGKEELNIISFPAGLATLTTAETNKLEKLAKALNERPEIYLDISRTINPKVDVLALREGPDSFTSERLKALINNPIEIYEDEHDALRELAMKRAQLIRQILEKNDIRSRRLFIIDKIQESSNYDDATIDVELKINTK